MVTNAVSWFEIPVSDFDRAKTFYGKIFNYEMPVMDMGHIRMGMLPHDQAAGGIGGAICKGEGYQSSGNNGTKVYLNGGADLSAVLSRVADAGGQVVLEKTMIAPDLGYMAVFSDTEGNVVGLFSPN